MIFLREFEVFTARFSQCVYEPLRIVFYLRGARLVNYAPLHLDGLLARAVVELATEGRGVQDREEGYWLPLPLKMLWRDDEGFPLWAASVLYPIAPTVEDIYVRHKRNSGGWLHSKCKLVTRNGPWMERRLPTPIQVCDVYEARCIGNLEAVKNLLSIFTHIGKLRLGRIKNIIVTPADYMDIDVWLDGVKIIRPMPDEARILKMWPGAPTPIGWTPPYWKPSLFKDGWRAGTKVYNLQTPDFFDACCGSQNG